MPDLHWMPIADAPLTGESVLLLLGETIPDHADVRAGNYVSGSQAEELGYPEHAKRGAWMIWHDEFDWRCIDVSDPLGWFPAPVAIKPLKTEAGE
jgi:hypothetical protein